MTNTANSPINSRRQAIFVGAQVGFVVTILLNMYYQWPLTEFIVKSGATSLIGAVSGLVWMLIPRRIQAIIGKASSLTIIILFVAVYQYGFGIALLWGLSQFISSVMIAFFDLPAPAIEISYLLSGLLVFLYIVNEILAYVIGTKIKQSDSAYPVDLAPLDARYKESRISDEWRKFKAKLQQGDEVWFWTSPRWTWKMCAGREGYVIVRNGRATRHRILTGLN